MSNALFQNVNLETERLRVRPLRPADAGDLHAVVSQPEVVKFLPEDVMTLEEVNKAIDWFQDCYRLNTREKIEKWTLGVVWKADSRVIGWCGLGPLDFNAEETELYCGLSESHWGQGVAVEACDALLNYAFQEMGFRRIVAVVNPENIQSRRLIDKLGMRLEKQVVGLADEFKFYEGFLYFSRSG